MPFWLTNTPACFQRGLYNVITKYEWKTCLIYLDELIIFSNNLEDHIGQVDVILTPIHEASVTLKIKKCHFFQLQVENLVHIINPGQLEIDQANVQSL